MPQGSTWPPTDDAFRTINEGTSPFTANVVNELAEAVEALQQFLGINPHDYSGDLGITAFADLAAALRARMAFEIGSFAHLGSQASVNVNFAHPNRFTIPGSTSNPIVITHIGAAAEPHGRDSFSVGNITSTGFTSYRYRDGFFAPGDFTIRYIAMNPLMWS